MKVVIWFYLGVILKEEFKPPDASNLTVEVAQRPRDLEDQGALGRYTVWLGLQRHRRLSRWLLGDGP